MTLVNTKFFAGGEFGFCLGEEFEDALQNLSHRDALAIEKNCRSLLEAMFQSFKAACLWRHWTDDDGSDEKPYFFWDLKESGHPWGDELPISITLDPDDLATALIEEIACFSHDSKIYPKRKAAMLDSIKHWRTALDRAEKAVSETPSQE
jgi:hypothetical protein